MAELFWLVLSLGCLIWYFVMLGLVIFKGAGDIRELLARLVDAAEKPESEN